MSGAALSGRFRRGCPIATIGDRSSRRSTSGKDRCCRRSSNRRARQWERWQLHRAANLYHIAQSLPPGTWRRYKVAWIASCILYDRRKLEAVGGFSFWPRLPRYHSGEEVLVQNLLMRRWGGCGMVPSGTYYSQVPTTVLNDRGSVDGHALDLLPEMVERYATAAGAQLVASPERSTPDSANPDWGLDGNLVPAPEVSPCSARRTSALASGTL